MNTQKPLLAILVEELPKIGGWPDDMNYCGQSAYDNELYFYRHPYTGQPCDKRGIFTDSHRSEYAYTPISRYQYEAALAASRGLRPYQVSTEHYTADTGAGKTASAADANGWIDWHGGECPVDSDAIVEVKFREPCQIHFSNDRAGDFTWLHYGHTADIIAYRLVNKHELETACIDRKLDAVKPNDAQLEADLNDCIGQPQSNDYARDEILYELANFAATTKTSLDIGVATEIAIWLAGKGYRKQ